MKKIVSMFLLLTVFLSGCQNPSPDSASDVVTVDSMGVTMNFSSSPKKIVALGYDLAEMLVMLGMGDRIIAVAPSMYLLEDVKEEYRDEISAIPVLPDGHSTGVPTLETVLSKNPDFVLGYSYSFAENSAGKTEDYIANGVNFYATEGTYIKGATMENTYNDFINLGKILGVSETADALVSEMKTQVDKVANTVSKAKPVSVYVFDSGSPERLLTIGGTGFQHSLIEMAGGANIFDDLDSDFATVSMEELIARNPEVIVIVEYYSADMGQQKINFLNSTPELQNITAVQNQNYIVISGYSFFPCGQNVDLVEQLAKGFHPTLFP